MKLFFSTFLLSVVACSRGEAVAPSSTTDMIESLKSKTVALIEVDDDETHVFCTGVWVSDQAILTAAHCVDDLTGGSKVRFVIESDVYEAGNPVPRSEIKPRIATLTATDDAHDLALLTTTEQPDAHGIAVLTSSPVVQGQTALEVGHPLQLWWSFSRGEVAAIRYKEAGLPAMLWVQATTPTSPGNSGGGLFDESASLIGICSRNATRGQNVNFFVHPMYIKSFLTKSL